MFKETKEALHFCKTNGIKMIDFKTIDLVGRWKHLTIPAENLSEDTMIDGIGFDGSNFGYAPVEKSDMVFIPNLESAAIDPFMKIPTLSMTGDVMIIDSPKNKRFDQYPRNVAKAALEFMRAEGVADEMIIGPEFEYYIFDHVNFETLPDRVAFRIDSNEAIWNAGVDDGKNSGYKTPHKGGYHEALPRDITCDLRSQTCLMLEEWGVGVKYHHHEVGGPGQVEIEVKLGDMLKMADDTMITKYIVRNAAVAVGKTATFLPKPIFEEAGSGMHVHMLLKKGGEPIFHDPAGYSQLSETALFFMGGILKHARSLCAITNPSTNSYKRLVPGFEAPVTVGYATANRSAIIRIPAYAKTPASKRFELRSPDATCNPYYAYAAILMAGLDGVKNKIDPCKHHWGPFDFNMYEMSDDERKHIQFLPGSLGESLDALEADNTYLTAGNVFPEALLGAWIKLKRQEERYIGQIPHPVEFTKYYDL